jgi:hypothetical protein
LIYSSGLAIISSIQVTPKIIGFFEPAQGLIVGIEHHFVLQCRRHDSDGDTRLLGLNELDAAAQAELRPVLMGLNVASHVRAALTGDQQRVRAQLPGLQELEFVSKVVPRWPRYCNARHRAG